jgi:DNA modification methylase
MILCMDCLEWMKAQPDNSIDLIFGSPPYEVARRYGSLNFSLKGQAWVDWMVERWVEMNRICKGLVAMVVEGQTRNFKWSATPALLMADLHRAGMRLRKPPAYARAGIPGSGGPDWLANRYEFIVCTSKGRLPWSDNKAMGKPPKYGPGGALSHHGQNGRVSGRRIGGGGPNGYRNGDVSQTAATRRPYYGVDIANPGNIIQCSVGGGKMGHKLASEGEAPFHLDLAEFFLRSFCPPGGVVCDPYSGSGTVAEAAQRWGRGWVAIDIRQDQCDLIARRIKETFDATMDQQKERSCSSGAARGAEEQAAGNASQP